MDNGQNKRVAKRIRVFGIVQGVGFRPLVYRIAKIYKITGTVRNVGSFVEITAHSSQENFDLFLQEIKTNQSIGCEIVRLEVEDIADVEHEDVVDVEHEDIADIENVDVVDVEHEDVVDAVNENVADSEHIIVVEVEQEDFIIISSGNSDEVSIIPPDLPVCPDCQKELYLESDRRFTNPFISCMSCGPRYTIVEELPYDRNNTTMKEFAMCDLCNEEYTAPDHRRFHAQTISCNDCGPYLLFQGSTTQELKEQEALDEAIAFINDGGIIAVKGIGGYHFVCSPFQEDTVINLRRLKGREEKPFAVMFEDLLSIESFCLVSEEEKLLLETKARPIVLLYTNQNRMAPSTNKGSIYCGAFLPYTPLQMLLTNRCGPLIMTSANRSNKPIIKYDDEMLSVKSPYLNGVLYNKRRIVRSVDDSVAKIIDHKPQMIRRSRGYVPYPVFITMTNQLTQEINVIKNINGLKNINVLQDTNLLQKTNLTQERVIFQDNNLLKGKFIENNNKDIMIFAAGGDLKAAYCLYKNGNAVVSQYFGDLVEISVMEEYKNSMTDLSRLLKISPSLAVCDMHPNYYSSSFARTLGIPVLQVQHHHAHIASVMAEHDLKERVIGIAFDGTGYGTDGNIWGGEFLICEGAEFIRAAHLAYTPMLGGDSSLKDAKKTATCFLLNAGLDEYVKDERKDIILAAITNQINTVLTSSMGRLFDAVAAILEIQQDNRYEGECAASLEREAVFALRDNLEPTELSFAINEKSEIIEIDARQLLETICRLRETVAVGSLALGFHYAVTESIVMVCERIRSKLGINTVALCGGVFQNTILTEQSLKILREKGFCVYVNKAVPPNDGSISLGQTFIGLMKKHLE